MKEPRFVIIPEYIDTLDISDSQKLLAGRIYALCAKKGYCYASNKFLAEDRKCSIKSIEKRIQALIKIGAFTSIVERQGKKITRRKLFIGDVPTELKVPSKMRVPAETSERTLQIEGTGTLQNEGESSRVVSSRDNKEILPTAVGNAKRVYGNPEINEIIAYLEEKLDGVPMDDGKKNRNYAQLMLNEIKKLCVKQGFEESKAVPIIKSIINAAFQGWHKKNATSVQYIYRNMGKIIQESKTKSLNVLSV